MCRWCQQIAEVNAMLIDVSRHVVFSISTELLKIENQADTRIMDSLALFTMKNKFYSENQRFRLKLDNHMS